MLQFPYIKAFGKHGTNIYTAVHGKNPVCYNERRFKIKLYAFNATPLDLLQGIQVLKRSLYKITTHLKHWISRIKHQVNVSDLLHTKDR
jgi:hypothetical protein